MSIDKDKKRISKSESSKGKKKTAQKGGKQTAAERRKAIREKRGESPYAAFETDIIETDSYSDFEEKAKKPSYSNFEDKSLAQPDEERDIYFDTYYGRNSKHSGASKGKAKSKNSSPKAQSKSGTSGKKIRKEDYLTEPVKVKELTAKQRKFRAMLTNVAVFLGVVIIAILVSVTILFKTDEFVIEGENIPYDTQQIVDASGLDYGDNIFLTRRKAAAKKIVNNFPYIENAEVSFRIPGTMIITLETAIPSYEVKVNDGYAVISAQGRVLEKSIEPYPNIPLLKGVRVTDTEVGHYINFENDTTRQILAEVIDNINENSVPDIYGIDISNTANIKLNYDNRITILLGVPEDVGYKLRTAMAIINHQLASTDKGDLDVSLANSDRKASYFTPIYSNTVTIDTDVSADKNSDSDTSSSTNSSAVPNNSQRIGAN